MLIRIGEAEIYAEWKGADEADEPAMVFLHDGLGSVRAWGDVPELLCRAVGRRGLAFDRQGYGRSSVRREFATGFLEDEAERLKDLLDALGLERVHLIGHSDGASIALLFASEHPGRTLSLIAEAPHTFVEERTQEGVRRHLLPLAESAGRIPPWLRKQHGGRTEELLRAWIDRWTSQSQRDWDMRDRLVRIQCPILVVQGDRDEYATLEQVETILSRVDQASACIVPDCGHVPHSERKQEFVRRASEFLSQFSGRA